MMHSLKYYFLLTIILIEVKAQIGLQVEFERGYPLHEDFIKDDNQKSDSSLQLAQQLSTQSAVGPQDDQSLGWRLPRDVMPEEYDLILTPILNENVPGLGNEFTAPGEVTIAINVFRATNQITMHLAAETYITVHTYEVCIYIMLLY